MNSFKIALINELEKLFKKKRALLIVIISLIFIVLGQISIILLRKNFGVVGTSSAEFPILILSILSNTILPLFILLMTIESFSNEFSQNTFKIALTRPITRFKLYSAKIISVLIFIFSNLMLVFIISVISGFIFNERYISSGNIGKIFISYIVTMMPLIVVCLAAVFFSNIIKNGLAVFFLFILVFIGLKVFGIFFSTYSGILFTSTLGWYNLWIMDEIPIFEILIQFLMMLSYDIIFFTAGYYLFDKKDF